MKVVLLESLGISEEERKKREQPFLAEGVEFFHYERTKDPSALQKEMEGAQAAVIANMPLPDEVIGKADSLRFLDVAFTGVDHVGLEACRRKGIVVSNASGYSTEAVAELALALTLSLYRQLREKEDRCRAGMDKGETTGREIRGKTVGIIGLGKIGTRSAQIFHALGADILASSRTVHEDAPSYVKQVRKEQLLREADIVLLHCPLNASTRGMMNKEAISMMKRSAVLVNAARGPVVSSKDLADALNEGRIAGAGIDVFDREPPLDPEDPLLHAKNVVVTPHTAFATKESMIKRADIVFENLRCWMDGRPANLVP